MKVLGGIFLVLLLVFLGVFVYAQCTDQTFIDAINTIINAIFGTTSNTPGDVTTPDITTPDTTTPEVTE